MVLSGMSAFRGKADVGEACPKRLLLTLAA